MDVVTIVWAILYYILFAYMILLWARIVLSFVQVFSPQWKPTGFLLVVAEVIFTATDPPIRALGKVIPPLRLGQVQLDLAFLVVILLVSVLMNVVGRLMVSAA